MSSFINRDGNTGAIHFSGLFGTNKIICVTPFKVSEAQCSWRVRFYRFEFEMQEKNGIWEIQRETPSNPPAINGSSSYFPMERPFLFGFRPVKYRPSCRSVFWIDISASTNTNTYTTHTKLGCAVSNLLFSVSRLLILLYDYYMTTLYFSFLK